MIGWVHRLCWQRPFETHLICREIGPISINGQFGIWVVGGTSYELRSWSQKNHLKRIFQKMHKGSTASEESRDYQSKQLDKQFNLAFYRLNSRLAMITRRVLRTDWAQREYYLPKLIFHSNFHCLRRTSDIFIIFQSDPFSGPFDRSPVSRGMQDRSGRQSLAAQLELCLRLFLFVFSAFSFWACIRCIERVQSPESQNEQAHQMFTRASDDTSCAT